MLDHIIDDSRALVRESEVFYKKSYMRVSRMAALPGVRARAGE